MLSLRGHISMKCQTEGDAAMGIVSACFQKWQAKPRDLNDKDRCNKSYIWYLLFEGGCLCLIFIFLLFLLHTVATILVKDFVFLLRS